MKPSNSSLPLSVDQWLDVNERTMRALLTENGQDVNRLPKVGITESSNSSDRSVQVPLPQGWLRLFLAGNGRQVGQWVADPITMHPVGAPLLFEESEVEGLEGWLVQDRRLAQSLTRWWQLRRDPQRQRYAVVVYACGEPTPLLALAGVYPEVQLCGEHEDLLAFVEPHPDDPGRAQAAVVPIDTGSPRQDARVLAEGPAAGVRIASCSTPRYVKVGHGVRSARVWHLFDLTRSYVHSVSLIQPCHDPDLLDVALLDGEPVLVQGANSDEDWRIEARRLQDGESAGVWCVAAGEGLVYQVLGRDGSVVARINRHDASGPREDLSMFPLSEPSLVASTPLLSTRGMFELNLNIAATSAGLAVVESTAVSPPVSWYFDRSGRLLNPDRRPSLPDVHFARENVVSSDGYEFSIDICWRGDSAQFRGPVILLLYGAYGIDIDLNSYSDLGLWLEQGFAVATANVRGGGDEQRHRDGFRDRRDRAVADAVAAVCWLRSGRGATTSTQICAVGASAGGFLVASLVADGPVAIDAAVIVNGYIDPLEALTRDTSLTVDADRDEWGDPESNARDREALESLSPLRKLTTPQASMLVAVSARDVQVDPRQGLAWALRAKQLGGEVTLWYDPEGTHDTFAPHLEPTALVDWVSNALKSRIEQSSVPPE